MASGGNCQSGAAAAVLGKWVTNATSTWDNVYAQGVAATITGGIASQINGGTFANGARTAAFGYLFNQMLSKEEADAKAAARNRSVMKGGGCVAEAANACAGIPVTSGAASSEAQENAVKLAVSMHPVGRVVVGAIDGVSIVDSLVKGNVGDAAATGSSVVVGSTVEKATTVAAGKSVAGRLGAVAGSVWDAIVSFFRN